MLFNDPWYISEKHAGASFVKYDIYKISNK